MKYWDVIYYKSLNSIHRKYIKALNASDAIKKSRVKLITDIIEITEAEYNEYMAAKINRQI